jgi:hypothetical protein
MRNVKRPGENGMVFWTMNQVTDPQHWLTCILSIAIEEAKVHSFLIKEWDILMSAAFRYCISARR